MIILYYHLTSPSLSACIIFIFMFVSTVLCPNINFPFNLHFLFLDFVLTNLPIKLFCVRYWLMPNLNKSNQWVIWQKYRVKTWYPSGFIALILTGLLNQMPSFEPKLEKNIMFINMRKKWQYYMGNEFINQTLTKVKFTLCNKSYWPWGP